MLIASKPAGKFLELGTGAGSATAWILEGTTSDAHLISVESDEALIAIAQKHLGTDSKFQLMHSFGEEMILVLPHNHFDLIFADT